MEKKVLAEEEINKLKDLKLRFKQLTDVVGETEVQIMNLEFAKNNLKQQFTNIQQEEVKLAKELEEKYGKGSISLDSGEFLPSN
tara:strand:- start:14 stop:265 length:252 start_codon:yes stop_codon:yes gene_type:complete